MAKCPTLLEELGGEAGCRRLSAAFYARVRTDPTLRPLFPGKTLKCAIEEFAAFLIQFLGGDEEQTQRRWSLSLRESHARFQIGPAERRAWFRQMAATLDESPLDGKTRTALRQFFECSSAYVIGDDATRPEHSELAERWSDQRVLDETVAAIVAGDDSAAMSRATRFVSRPAVFVGVMARMLRSGRPGLAAFVVNALEQDPLLRMRQYGGRSLLHYASAAGCVQVVTLLLRLGADPDVRDSGGHTPLYRAASECGSPMGPLVVRALVAAGADVNARSGVTRATALHMAARRDYLAVARMLLECGAALNVRDRKGDTPLERAVNCRRAAMAQLLRESGQE